MLSSSFVRDDRKVTVLPLRVTYEMMSQDLYN
jgi:hypothetical protein